MNFGQAQDALRAGKKVCRENWNGKGIFVALHIPDEHSKMTHQYTYMDTTGLHSANANAPRNCVPWHPSHTDLWASDWVVLDN